MEYLFFPIYVVTDNNDNAIFIKNYESIIVFGYFISYFMFIVNIFL